MNDDHSNLMKLHVMSQVISNFASDHGINIQPDDDIIINLINNNKERITKESDTIYNINNGSTDLKDVHIIEHSFTQYLKIIKSKLKLRSMGENFINNISNVAVDINGNIVELHH